jgi:hypothetical protein
MSVQVWGRILGLFLFASVCAAACTRRDALDAIRVGEPLALAPASKIERIAIAKSGPAAGDRWSAEISRSRPEASTAFRWQIVSAPGGFPLRDARADGFLISHLLDSLETLRVTAKADPRPLSELGLEPPRFAIRWISASHGSGELWIGAGGPARGQAYALLPRLSRERPILVSGSLLRVLEEVVSFESLRQRAWTETGPDDINEIEVRRQGQTVLHAERERGRWIDGRGRPLKRDMDGLLEGLVSTGIRDFLDEGTAAGAALARLERRPDYRAILTDGRGRKLELTLSQERTPFGGRAALALSSERPQAPFRLPSEVLDLLK